MDFGGFIDIFLLGVGLYCFYAWYMLTTKGEINKRIFMSQDMDEKKFKDKKGFVAYMKPRLLFFTVWLIVYGVLGVINSYYKALGNTFYIFMLVTFIVLGWFALTVKKAHSKFY